MKNKHFILVLITATIFLSCKNNSTESLFNIVNSKESGVDFINTISDSDTLNILDYLYYYNGAGVAAGDINNDGLVDLYFVSNRYENKLYLNKGNLKFEDISSKAGVGGNADWSTGVTMVDVNNDGWLDIYVCTVTNHSPQTGSKMGRTFFINGKNELFINNKNGTFTEQAAQYGLDIKGYNTQSAFFDYDNDGDKDMFLLQHSIHQTDTYGDTSLRKKYSDISGCKMYQNDKGKFRNVTTQTGLLSSALGYGLGVAISDFNHDGWQDIYVGNDFHESDYYFLNNGNGTFSEKNQLAFGHQSNFSMGNDAADINNDGWTDIITLDMLPADEKVLKSSANEEAIDTYESQRSLGYSYQYARNALQLNTGKGNRFSEIALYSGVAATDWSWSVLANDFDLDGNKDLFITNGIKQRMNDLDYVKFISSNEIKTNAQGTRLYDNEMLKKQPKGEWHNYFFKGQANLKFEDKSIDFGFKKPNLSNGSAYADLDNDGDLDLITNNINSTADIYENKATAITNTKWLSVQLKDSLQDAIGAKCFVYTKQNFQMQELYTTRGFMSSVQPILSFGFSDTALHSIDSIIVVWNRNEYSKWENVATNTKKLFEKKNTFRINDYSFFLSSLLKEKIDSSNSIENGININWTHKENNSFIDFNRQWFIPHMYSTRGPAIAVADVNGDGLDDVYLGGAKSQPSVLMIQSMNGSFSQLENIDITNDSICEDVDAIFFDADNDKDNDLLVVSGGNEYFDQMKPLADRLYINDGNGKFTKSTSFPELFENKSCVTAADINNDGAIDLFIGGHLNSKEYGIIPNSFLLLNDGKGNFREQTQQWNKELQKIGMVSDAKFADLNNDKMIDLIIVGEWMAPSIFINKKNSFELQKSTLPKGWYQHVNIIDINNDTYPDIFLGNYGSNTKLSASKDAPIKMYITDLDNNKVTDQIMAIQKDGVYYPYLPKELLEKQLPYLKKEYLSYEKMAGQSIQKVFGEKLNKGTLLEAEELKSYWVKNNGKGQFEVQEVPFTFQWSPVMTSFSSGNQLWVGGNFYGTLPYEGRYDAVAIQSAVYEKGNFTGSNINTSINGEVRNIVPIKIKGNDYLIIAKNNAAVSLIKRTNK